MSNISKSEKFDHASVTLSIDMESVRPSGYIFKNGERYPILIVFMKVCKFINREEMNIQFLLPLR